MDFSNINCPVFGMLTSISAKDAVAIEVSTNFIGFFFVMNIEFSAFAYDCYIGVQ